MMSCDSNYVKKVDTCKGAANWNQYMSPFITNRQLINGAGALQLTRVSFTQLPAKLDGRSSVALFREHWLVRAGVDNWLFSWPSIQGDSKQVLYCTEPSMRAAERCSVTGGGGGGRWSLDQSWAWHCLKIKRATDTMCIFKCVANSSFFPSGFELLPNLSCAQGCVIYWRKGCRWRTKRVSYLPLFSQFAENFLTTSKLYQEEDVPKGTIS